MNCHLVRLKERLKLIEGAVTAETTMVPVLSIYHKKMVQNVFTNEAMNTRSLNTLTLMKMFSIQKEITSTMFHNHLFGEQMIRRRRLFAEDCARFGDAA